MKTITTKKGKKFTFLTPNEKASKCAKELKQNSRFTNDGTIKTNEKGKKVKLSKDQKAFRAGYLSAQQDNHDAYNAKHNPTKLKANRKARYARLKARKSA